MLRLHWPCCRVIASTLALLLTSSSSLAQSTSSDWSTVQNLASGLVLSVRTRTGAKYHGEMVTATPDSLIINSDERAFPGRTVRRREFARSEVREIRLTAYGASLAAGAVIGGAAGAGIGVALDSTAKSHEYRGVVAFVLGVLGAGIGAAIAHHHPFVKGKKIYVDPRSDELSRSRRSWLTTS